MEGSRDLVSSLSSSTRDQAPETSRARTLEPAFLDLCAALADDLASVKALVDATPAREGRSPAEIAERFYPAFEKWLDSRLDQVAALTHWMSNEERDSHGEYLRKKLRPFTNESEFLRRTNERPRGYAGDSEMMRMIYDADFRGDSVFGRLLHRHPLESAAAQAVRHRIGLIGEVIRERRAKRAAPLRVLSLACGPARELRHIIESADDAEGIELVFADQDEDALGEARAEIAHVEESIGTSLRAGTRSVSVRDILRSPEATAAALGTFDVIYTLGLFDYLTEPVARKLVTALTRMLRRRGTLIVGNFHLACESRAYLDLWMNWPLLYRSEAEMVGLADDVEHAKVAIESDPTGSQMFLSVTRAA